MIWPPLRSKSIAYGRRGNVGCARNGKGLRILHVIRAKPPGELGGADLHVADLATSQLSKGHQVGVVCLGPAEVSNVLRARGVPFAEVRSLSMLRWFRFLARELHRRRPDVVHSHGYRADIISLLVTHTHARRRCTTVMTAHGFIRTSLGVRLLTRANEWALRRADVVIAASSAESARLTGLLGRPVVFVPNGISPPQLVERHTARVRLGVTTPRCVGFVGRLSPEKRPDLFLDMAALLAASDRDTTFALIGSGPVADRLSQGLAEHLRDRVVFAGLLPDAASLLSAFDVLVCPSDTEGTPRVIIEAMSAGVPVVATRVGGVPNLLTHQQTGILTEPGSSRALADSVRQVLDLPDFAAAIADRAKSAAQVLTSEWMEEQTARAYRAGTPAPAVDAEAA